MVKVREDYPVTEGGYIDITQWSQRIIDTAGLDDKSLPLLIQAADMANSAEQQVSASDNLWFGRVSSFLTGLEMTDILADLHLDLDPLLAAILYRSVREQKLSITIVRESFGETVAKLIDGVLRMAAISSLRNDSEHEVFGKQSAEQTNNVRKMLVAIVDDVRVALIKLAERTCAIRAVKDADSPKRLSVAKEVADIYAPLAHRLGIGHIKWELEDLSFRYLKPNEYKHIAKLLDEKRLDRQSYIDKVIDTITTQITKNNIHADISGRAKHIFSIWRKMQRKGIGFSEVYDIRAVRILVPTTKDCYEVLGIIHTLWRNIPHEFDDYIAAPKENGYRSLHTAVFGPDNKILEVQIRSETMHEEAEFGVCAHWRYKGTDTKQTTDSYEQKISWLRQVLEWHEELGVNPLVDDLNVGVEQDRIYVFTPDGHIMDLPQGSTPLDFAYRVHTEIGHRCRGAKVNGRIVPLNYTLQTSEQVEVLTGKQDIPSRDWLVEGLGYVNTSRARAKVRQWFSEQARDQNITDGKALLDKEFKRLAFSQPNFAELVALLKYKSLDDLYAAVGASELTVGQVLRAAQKMLSEHSPTESTISLTGKAPSSAGNDVYIEGVGNLLTTIARCCSPLPGDAITGYITLSRGVSIHRQDCSNILQLQSDEPERIIKVAWGEAPKEVYSVDIIMEAYDRGGLLKDIATLLDNKRINVSAMQTLSNKGQNTVEMMISVDIKNFSELSQILAHLNQLPNIVTAHRKVV